MNEHITCTKIILSRGGAKNKYVPGTSQLPFIKYEGHIYSYIYASNQNVSLPKKYTVFKKISRQRKKVVREACPWDKMVI